MSPLRVGLFAVGRSSVCTSSRIANGDQKKGCVEEE